MKDFTLEERIAIIAGSTSWIGGDSARIDIKTSLIFLVSLKTKPWEFSISYTTMECLSREMTISTSPERERDS